MPHNCNHFAAGKVWRVTAYGEHANSGEIQNVYQVHYNGPDDPHTLNQAIEDMEEFVEALYDLVIEILDSNTTFSHYAVDGLGEVCVSGRVALSNPKTGLMVGNDVPSGVAALVNFPTNVARVQLRKYFGVLGVGALASNGRLNNTALTDLQAVGDWLTDPFLASSGRGYVYGYESPKAGGFIVPNSASASNIPAYQRRRRPGTGS